MAGRDPYRAISTLQRGLKKAGKAADRELKRSSGKAGRQVAPPPPPRMSDAERQELARTLMEAKIARGGKITWLDRLCLRWIGMPFN